MKANPVSILPLLLLGAHITPAFAQPQSEVQLASHPAATVTLSPIHLFIGVVELTGEYRAHEHLGVAATLGAGKVDEVSVYEVGARPISTSATSRGCI